MGRFMLVNQSKSARILFYAMMFLVLEAVILPCGARGQEAREPLTKTEVIRLLENGVSTDRVGALAKQYGIAFQLTEDAEKEIRAAGANDELIGMLKALAPTAAPPPTPPSAAKPAKEEPAKPAEPKKYLLRDGTAVRLKFAQDLSSKNAMEGDAVNFVLAEDVWVGDALVVRSGATAVGEVSHVQRPGFLGKPAELNVRINYMKVGATRVRLRGTKGKETAGSTGTLGILLAPLGLLMPGKQIEVKEGTHLTAYVDEDVKLPAPR
jgi:hypothetical protein